MTRILLCFFLSLYFNSIHVLSTEYGVTKALRTTNNAYLTVNIDDETDLVTMELTVDSDRWVGAGFGSTKMTDTYAVIAYGTTDIYERKLAHDAEGSELTSTLTTISDTIEDSIRTLIVTRNITIGDSDYYDFSSIGDGTTINMIWGVGASTTWDEHASDGTKSLTFNEIVPTEEPTSMPTSIPTDPTNAPAEKIVSFNIDSDEDALYELSCDMSIYDDDSIILTLGGPSGQWMGFGFGAVLMDGTYAIIVDGNDNIEQRILGDWVEGRVLADNVTSNFSIVSIDEDDSGMRYIEVTQNINNLYYDFGSIVDSLEYIMASSESVMMEAHDWDQSGTVMASEMTTPAPNDVDSSGGVGNMRVGMVVMIGGLIVYLLIN